VVADGRSSGRRAGEGTLCNAESIRGDERYSSRVSHAAQRRAEKVAGRSLLLLGRWMVRRHGDTANGEKDAAG